MPYGTIISEPLTRFKDPVTGRQMIRVTDLAAHCHHPYFYSRMFTPDGKKLMYTSYRTGRPNAYLVDLASGRSMQLTDAKAMDGFMSTLSADGTSLFYVDGNSLMRLAIDSGKTETLYTQQPPYDERALYPGFSSDYRYVLLSQMHRDDIVKGKSGWDAFEPQFRAAPRCRLLYLDLVRGTEHVVLEEQCWLGHPQIHPKDPGLLMYCHEGPGHLIDNRMWLIRNDGTQQRPIQISNREKFGTPSKEIVTHEYFTPDGTYAAAVYLPGPTPGRIVLAALSTGDITDLGEVHSYLHFIHSPDMRYIVGDERSSAMNTAAIWVFDMATKQEMKICLHASSLKPRGASTQDAHPHPSFSPDMRYILFSSDRETSPDGNCAVYLADVNDLKQQLQTISNR
ncbi:MAG: PD40 domain-containing protein [Spirochaetes bacterium]|nr:PD40 domain-containing protein [Spirochaetota bacterium]